MYSKSLLQEIKWHEFRLYRGISEWPESVYGRDYAGQYQRRLTRSPLPLDDACRLANFTLDDGPDSYVIKITEEGDIEVLSGS
jgi:hypothetical protein